MMLSGNTGVPFPGRPRTRATICGVGAVGMCSTFPATFVCLPRARNTSLPRQTLPITIAIVRSIFYTVLLCATSSSHHYPKQHTEPHLRTPNCNQSGPFYQNTVGSTAFSAGSCCYVARFSSPRKEATLTVKHCKKLSGGSHILKLSN